MYARPLVVVYARVVVFVAVVLNGLVTCWLTLVGEGGVGEWLSGW